MSDLEVSHTSILTMLGGAVAGLLGWLIRLERRIGASLSREEHQSICEARNQSLREDLAEIKTTLERQDDRSANYRASMEGAIFTISSKLAVLEERMTGTARKRSRK